MKHQTIILTIPTVDLDMDIDANKNTDIQLGLEIMTDIAMKIEIEMGLMKFRLPFGDHYGGVLMGVMASQITSLTIVYSTVYSGAIQAKHQSSASLAFVWGIHR